MDHPRPTGLTSCCTVQHDLTLTVFCPRAARCEICGSAAGLDVITVEARAGILCMTACRNCEPAPSRLTDTAVRAAAHATHVCPRATVSES